MKDAESSWDGSWPPRRWCSEPRQRSPTPSLWWPQSHCTAWNWKRAINLKSSDNLIKNVNLISIKNSQSTEESQWSWWDKKIRGWAGRRPSGVRRHQKCFWSLWTSDWTGLWWETCRWSYQNTKIGKSQNTICTCRKYINQKEERNIDTFKQECDNFKKFHVKVIMAKIITIHDNIPIIIKMCLKLLKLL